MKNINLHNATSNTVAGYIIVIINCTM